MSGAFVVRGGADRRVGAREHEGFVPGVEPPHDVRWRPVLTADLEDLAVPLVVVDVGAAHVEAVTDCGPHDAPYSARVTGTLTAGVFSVSVGTRTSSTPSVYDAVTSSGFAPAGSVTERRNEP